MQLKSIKLENIRSYLNENITFPTGSLLLSGDIGAGKSTILHAIEFALFGIKRGDLSGATMLRNGKQQGSVELTFTLNQNKIIIKRSLKRAKTGIQQDAGYIIINDKKQDGVPQELKAKIFELLGYPLSLLTKSKDLLYRFTVYTPQEQMKQILLEDKETRLETLRKVFGIDRYKIIRENSQLVVRNLKEKIKIMNARIENLPRQKQELKECTESYKTKKEEHNKLTPSLINIEKLIVMKKEELKTIEQGISRLNKSKEELAQLEGELKQLARKQDSDKQTLVNLETDKLKIEKKLSELIVTKEDINAEDIEKLREKINSTLQSKIQIQTQIENNISQINSLNLELKQKAELELSLQQKQNNLNRFEEAAKKKEEIEKSIEQLNKERNNIKVIIQTSNNKKEDSIKLKDRISSMDNCMTCMQPVNEEHKSHIENTEQKKIIEENAKIEQANIKLNSLTSDLQKAQLELTKAASASITYERLITEIRISNKTIEELQKKELTLATINNQKLDNERKLKELNATDIEKEKQAINTMEAALNNSRERKHALELLKEKEKNIELLRNEQETIAKRIEDNLSKKAEINKYIRELVNVESNHAESKKELENLQEKYNFLKIKNVQLEKDIERKQMDIDWLQREVIEKEHTLAKINSAREMQNFITENFAPLMINMEKHIMAKLHSEFNALFREWFNILIEDENLNARLDDEFTPIIEQDGYETEAINLSGGEKTSLALAYRLALNKTINDFVHSINTKDLIILDEPTDGFSTEQLDKVRDVLIELNMPQVIIVSHENKIESFVDNTLHVIKNEHSSKILG